jgi:methyl-accepting chemotaxis protein
MSTISINSYSKNPDTKIATEEIIHNLKEELKNITLPLAFGVVFCGPKHDLSYIIKKLNELTKQQKIIGCTTAGEFTHKEHIHNGVVVHLVFSDDMITKKVVAQGMSSNLLNVVRKLTEGFSSFREESIKNGFEFGYTLVLTDGMSIEGEALVTFLQTRTHIQHFLFGGASGDEGKFKKTLVGDDEIANPDVAAVIHIFSKKPFGIGVNHGLRQNSEIMTVTRSVSNEILTINDKPAFEIYQAYAKNKGIDLNETNASEFFIKNEIGIIRHNEVVKARAPLYVSPNKGIVCAGVVLEGSKIAILDSDKEKLLEASRKAAEEAKNNAGINNFSGILVFDCICREAILQQQFKEEIETIQNVFGNIPVSGFLTYGEIAKYKGNLSGWHNTTAVVVAIPS